MPLLENLLFGWCPALAALALILAAGGLLLPARWLALPPPWPAAALPAAPGFFRRAWGVLLLLLVAGRARRVSPARGVLAVAVLLLAFANAVWWVSPGPTTVGALWAGLLFLWLFDRDELCGP